MTDVTHERLFLQQNKVAAYFSVDSCVIFSDWLPSQRLRARVANVDALAERGCSSFRSSGYMQDFAYKADTQPCYHFPHQNTAKPS